MAGISSAHLPLVGPSEIGVNKLGGIILTGKAEVYPAVLKQPHLNQPLISVEIQRIDSDRLLKWRLWKTNRVCSNAGST